MTPGRLDRRGLLASLGGLGAGAVLGAGGTRLEEARGDESPEAIPFFGANQAGIATPVQDRLHFAAFDVLTTSRSELRELLREWSRAAAQMCAGAPAGPRNATQGAPPDDTGEAAGLDPARLTVTLGFGPSLFDGRFGLAGRRPAQLAPLPPLPGERLEPSRSGGDLCVQACADDPLVAFHAVRNLARIGRGTVAMRWSQLGFGRTATTSRAQATPRNLMGFKDGTNNIQADDTHALAEHVWVGERDSPAWMQGGSYLVARRIAMLIEAWDRSTLADQERTIGRSKASGAALGQTREHDAVDLAVRAADGEPRVPLDAHIRLASPAANGGVRILRRGYSYTDGTDSRTGELDAGLFFLCFQRDPRRQFVALQQRLGLHDALNEYVVHTASALFACPPGARAGGYVGETLL